METDCTFKVLQNLKMSVELFIFVLLCLESGIQGKTYKQVKKKLTSIPKEKIDDNVTEIDLSKNRISETKAEDFQGLIHLQVLK